MDGLLTGFDEIYRQQSGQPMENLELQFGDMAITFDGPELFAASLPERMQELFRLEVTPVLRSLGQRGEELKQAIRDPETLKHANQVAAVAILLALVTGAEQITTMNLVAFTIAFLEANAMHDQPKH